MLMQVNVECHSEYTYAERPTAVYLDGERQEINHVLASWQTPEGRYFRVLLENDGVLTLVYKTTEDHWELHP
ncbi:MAG: hypothetical protein JXB38_12040 [Anaerolineales bacterium]|nr:hypothetical protein [Anaerolineales bacterium]